MVYATDYKDCPASATTVLSGQQGSGKAGDILENLVVAVSTAATSQVQIQDGANAAIILVPANTPIGLYSLRIRARSVNGAWSVITAAGVKAVATGRFQ